MIISSAQLAAHMACKISNNVVAIDRASFTDQCGFLCPISKSFHYTIANPTCQKVEYRKLSTRHFSSVRLFSSTEGFRCNSGKPYSHMIDKEHAVSCHCTTTRSSEAKECVRKSEDHIDASSAQLKDGEIGGTGCYVGDHQSMPGSASYATRGLAEACKFVYNDAKFVNERARNDIVLLSRGITRLNNRARQDVAVLGLGFLKLDARAREDREKIDHGMKNAAHIHYVATGKAQSELKRVADKHWSNGALEADLRRANFCFRRRAMEDAFMALKFVKRIHDMMANKLYQQPQKQGSFSVDDMMGFITLEKNGKALDLFAREVSTDRITAIQDAYWSMASALSEADGIDYTDPEEVSPLNTISETINIDVLLNSHFLIPFHLDFAYVKLELLVATLIDLDAMDGKSSASLLAECSSSPDVSTRQALANALAAAPSMWNLGNAGMGALQRLAEDSNPAVAAAASKAIDELKQQWELEEGDSLRFMMNQYSPSEDIDDSDMEGDNLSG